jgi:hypothetical protein
MDWIFFGQIGSTDGTLQIDPYSNESLGIIKSGKGVVASDRDSGILKDSVPWT